MTDKRVRSDWVRIMRPTKFGRGRDGRVPPFVYRPKAAGMTLVELLVAMVILLVGVWAIARGFPTLLRSVRFEQSRTEMARLAEGVMEQLKQAGTLPEAICGPLAPVAQAHLIHPDELPSDTDPAKLNSRDSIFEVVGEWLRVPAAPTGSSVSLALVSQGLIERDTTTTAVFLASQLKLLPEEWYAGGPVPDGYFRIDWASGNVLVPQALQIPPDLSKPVTHAIVDYAWRDVSGQVHWVQGEFIPVAAGSGRVSVAGAADFNGLVPGPARCVALSQLSLAVGDPTAAGTDVGIEDQFGVGLLFNLTGANAALAGQTVLCTYRVRLSSTNPPRRDIFMVEDRSISQSQAQADPSDPTMRYVEVQLARGPLIPLEGNTYVVAVDAESGQLYFDQTPGGPGAGIAQLSADQVREARARLHVPASDLGHRFRFFYRVEGAPEEPGGACIMVYKPPTHFIDEATWRAAGAPPSELYRVYSWQDDADGFRTLIFALSNTGFTVSVDYVYDADPGPNVDPQPVFGELHTLGPNSAGDAAICDLEMPNVIEIRAVRGVSVRVRAWWRRADGKLRHYDLDSILLPGALI